MLCREEATWVTSKPRSASYPRVVFLGVPASGKTTLITALVESSNRSKKAGLIAKLYDQIRGTPVDTALQRVALPIPPPTRQPLIATVAPRREQLVVEEHPTSAAALLADPHKAMRAFNDASAFVLVVDSADVLRLPLVSALVMAVHPLLIEKPRPLLILANKQDLRTALSPRHLQHRLDLPTLLADLGSPWMLAAVSAVELTPLRDALDWLCLKVVENVQLSGEDWAKVEQRYREINYRYALNFTDLKLKAIAETYVGE